MDDWKPNWYRLSSLSVLAEGQGIGARAGALEVVVHRRAGEVIAARDGCPRCAAGLAAARVAGNGKVLACPGCGAELALDPGSDPPGIGIPVMVVDEEIYVYAEQTPTDGP